MTLNLKILQLQGIKFGIVSQIIGCGVFVLVEQTRQTLMFGYSGKSDILFALLVFLFGCMLAIFPTAISSSILSYILHRQTIENKLSSARAIQTGILVGAITAIGISILGMIATSGRGSLSVYLSYTIEVVVIGSICGGWSGKMLANYIFDFHSPTP